VFRPCNAIVFLFADAQAITDQAFPCTCCMHRFNPIDRQRTCKICKSKASSNPMALCMFSCYDHIHFGTPMIMCTTTLTALVCSASSHYLQCVQYHDNATAVYFDILQYLIYNICGLRNVYRSLKRSTTVKNVHTKKVSNT
jgi:hypothetical protein